jgi:hypothetical protein
MTGELMVPHPELNPLYQQIGEILQRLRAIGENIEIRHAQAEKLHDLARVDMATLRRDQRDLEEKLDCVICVMQHDLERLRSDASSHGRSVDELVRAVQELQVPVLDIIALRSRFAGALLGLGVLGSAALWLTEPVYRWIIEQNFLKH